MSERSLFWVEAAEITSLLTRIDEPGSPRPATTTPVTPSAVDTASSVEAAASASVTDSAALGLGELWLPEGSIEERLADGGAAASSVEHDVEVAHRTRQSPASQHL